MMPIFFFDFLIYHGEVWVVRCSVVLCHAMWNDRDGVFVARFMWVRGGFFFFFDAAFGGVVGARADFSSAEGRQGWVGGGNRGFRCSRETENRRGFVL